MKRVQGVVDEVPGLLADFPGPLSAHINRDKLAQLITARAAAAGQEGWCPQPDVLKACPTSSCGPAMQQT
jgi:hypothetical protein